VRAEPAVSAARALDRARRFLVSAQRATGELPVERTAYDDSGKERSVEPDSSPFLTAFAVLGLCADDSREAHEVRARAVTFVESQREWPGVWRFWGRGMTVSVPPDLDTTSVCQTLLAREGRASRSIAWLYRRSRDRTGRFRTWLTPGNIRTLHPVYWLLMLRELHPSRLILVWRTTSAHRRDRDVVVNANVVTFLGDGATTDGAIRWIIETVQSGEEETRDKWYHDREVLYLAIGRAYAGGVRRFDLVSDLISRRVAERTSPEGDIAGSALRTAMGAAAMLHLGLPRTTVERAIAWLVDAQDADGGWPSAPLHYGGPGRARSWGARAVTTALVVEAIALYESSHA